MGSHHRRSAVGVYPLPLDKVMADTPTALCVYGPDAVSGGRD